MKQFYQSSIYLHCIRPPTKATLHCCTGETEIERTSKNAQFSKLQYSLNHSKMLKRFLQKNPLDNKYNQQMFEQLCHIKNISDQQNKFYVRRALKEYQSFKYSEREVQELRRAKYNKDNWKHQEMLLEIWHNLMPHQQLNGRISDQWIHIGFQVNDPATDFRGAGYLGLLNLVRFSRNKLCMSVFRWAINKDTEYFFCSAGLFFTMTAVELMKQMIVPVQLWVFQKQDKTIDVFQVVYNMLFMQFDKFWKTCHNKSILQFNTNLQTFKTQIKLNSQFSIKQKMAYWSEV